MVMKSTGSQHPSPTSSNAARPERPREELPRAASYTYLPIVNDSQYADSGLVSIKGSTDEEHGVVSDDETVDIFPDSDLPADTPSWNTRDSRVLHTALLQVSEVGAALHTEDAKPKAGESESVHSSLSTAEPSIRQSGNRFESNRSLSTTATAPRTSKRPSLNKTIAQRLSGRSWYPSNGSTPSSRSPSPVKQDVALALAQGKVEAVDGESIVQSASRRKSFMARRKSTKGEKDIETDKKEIPTSDEETSTRATLTRKGTFLRKKATRAAGLSKVATDDERKDSGLAATAGSVPAIPAVPALPKSFSSDRLPALRSRSPHPGGLPKVPTEKRLLGPLSTSAKKKDELWVQFRNLDADYTKFTSKSTSLKANVVRNSLLPFLRTYATHPSNKLLRSEDLDRRASILNKWWAGLIEMLHGKHNQSISGTDRPVIFDGISGIMERAEWRLSPSPLCPLNQRTKVSLDTGSRSTTSLTSSSSDFLADSIHHNVRNIFTSNLVSQMAFVVDKMSLRHASASLVAFCGKACAYGFIFVPGMADILVRLWELPTGVLRRTLQEHGLGKFDRVHDPLHADIVSSFPPALQSLGVKSFMKFVRDLRTPPPLPLGTGHIQWWGRWVERWSGRESDLFYAFVKHYHILATDFLLAESTMKQRICAPGMLPVHAQILANLELTIHRDANQGQHESTNGPTTATFDDLLDNPDAVASALPIPPTNAVRVMAENRLVMLIRDLLSERSSDHPLARELFAESFNAVLQAAARGTSLFDHPACYTLLDFLEEAFVILVRYESLRPGRASLIDSGFWQKVCRRMIESENTMTEIRLYAFLFTVWNAISVNAARRDDFCMKLLLDPGIFESRFNHWCPMVRAYYMRLLCWRLGRYDGENDQANPSVFETLQHRLQHTWSHYTYLYDKAERDWTPLPDTGPCHPAPGRRLLIVRTDNVMTSSESFLTFDGLMRDAPMQFPKRTAAAPEELDSRPESSSSNMDSDNDSQSKGIGGLLRKMIGGNSSKTRSKSKENTPPATSSEGLPGAPHSASEKVSVLEPLATKPVEKPIHRSLTFKFSLEFHPTNKPHAQMRLFAPRLPAPASNLLLANGKLLPKEEVHIPTQPMGESVVRARYAGRALAEWMIVVGECQSFFDRRLKEGVPSRKWVETPTLGVEIFQRPS